MAILTEDESLWLYENFPEIDAALENMETTYHQRPVFEELRKFKAVVDACAAEVARMADPAVVADRDWLFAPKGARWHAFNAPKNGVAQGYWFKHRPEMAPETGRWYVDVVKNEFSSFRSRKIAVASSFDWTLTLSARPHKEKE